MTTLTIHDKESIFERTSEDVMIFGAVLVALFQIAIAPFIIIPAIQSVFKAFQG